jgi:hypothetical protein
MAQPPPLLLSLGLPAGLAHPCTPLFLPRAGCRCHLVPERRRVTALDSLPVADTTPASPSLPPSLPPLHGGNGRHQWCPSKHTTGRRRLASPSPPRTYKSVPRSRLTAPHTALLSSSLAPECAPTAEIPSPPPPLTVARPPHCLLSSGQWPIEFPGPVSPSSAPWPAPLSTRAARGQAPVSLGCLSMAGPRWIEPGVVHDPVDRFYGDFLYKNNSRNSLFQ